MDTRKEMIVIQGVIKTCKVALCEYNREMYSWNVWYNDGRFSIYRYDEVEKLTNPKICWNPLESISASCVLIVGMVKNREKSFRKSQKNLKSLLTTKKQSAKLAVNKEQMQRTEYDH